jgi:hypothetical protein
LERALLDARDEEGIEKSKFITIKAYDLKEKPPSAAGVAELAKGAGLKILFRRDTWVQIPPPALAILIIEKL